MIIVSLITIRFPGCLGGLCQEEQTGFAGAGAPVYLAAVMEYLAAEVGITEFEDIGNFELTIKEIRHSSDWILSFSFVIYVLDLYTVFRAISDRMYTEHILKMESVPFKELSLLTFSLQQAST
ncbi:hypothetical protein J6590_088898 [Homalodisca vitripennis]|nr:hypothetical protein J6590_088898 [Homalodisca vitripennis]